MANNQQLLMGEGAGGGIPNYIEDVFSTYLYTGNGSTQTITNGIDLDTKGGLVWIKNRTDSGVSHYLWDTVRGITPSSHKSLQSDTTAAQVDYSSGFGVESVSSTGFELGGLGTGVNGSTKNYASWTFRKQPKFFDIVTYTGNATSGRQIAHSLGSAPGMIIVKRTDAARNWVCYHQALGNGSMMILNSTAAVDNASALWNNTTPTSTYFTVNNDLDVNGSGATYVAYLFAHDAGGFGLTGADNVISCGTFTTDGSGNATVALGYEPQFAMLKRSSATSDWEMLDNMRRWSQAGFRDLYANSSSTEGNTTSSYCTITSTGFTTPTAGFFYPSSTYIYIAIRRGPMKVPTVGTSVFSPIARTGTGSIANVSVGFAPDFLTTFYRTEPGQDKVVFDRLRGSTQYLNTAATTQETNVSTNGLISFNNTTFTTNANGYANNSGSAFVNHVFGRAPGFFDEVCYTGNGAGSNAKTHNLTVAPELLIIKNRSSSGSGDWYTFHTFTSSNFKKQLLDTTDAQTNYTYGSFLDAQPTSTTFTVNSGAGCNESGTTYVAYLFATCAGVSKVGSYTGNGSSQTIACGFTAGSRFVMIKRTDSTGDWYVWDSARGIIAGNDPHLSLNTTAAEVTTDDSVDTDNSGFIVNQLSATNINVTSATYIFLAVS